MRVSRKKWQKDNPRNETTSVWLLRPTRTDGNKSTICESFFEKPISKNDKIYDFQAIFIKN